MTQHYRLLTKEEIARLEAQHCIASDWSGVDGLYSSHPFFGKSATGRF